jgi:hypothetical protein
MNPITQSRKGLGCKVYGAGEGERRMEIGIQDVGIKEYSLFSEQPQHTKYNST